MKKLSLILVLLLTVACLIPAIAEVSADYSPEPVAIVNAEDAIGSWTLCGAKAYGTYMGAEDLSITASLIVREGTVTLQSGTQIGTSTWVLLEDGTIEYTDPDGSTGLILMNDDGTLSLSTPLDDSEVLTLYFAKDAEAEEPVSGT